VGGASLVALSYVQSNAAGLSTMSMQPPSRRGAQVPVDREQAHKGEALIRSPQGGRL